jgi:hypothetical protein
MSTAVAVVTILSFLLGLINQGIGQGSILGGMIKVPPTWLPYLTIAASFVGGALTSLQGVATINGQALLNAVVAGILALSSAGGGVAMAHHVITRPKPPAPPKAA